MNIRLQNHDRKPYAHPAVDEVVTIADLLKQLGGIPAERVRLRPLPGTARERDILTVREREGRLCELLEKTLVEKTVGIREALLAIVLAGYLLEFLDRHPLNVVAGADGPFRLASGLVRIPDVSFIAWDRFPNRVIPEELIPHLAPDLAVEVLSKGNTKREMIRKLREYFVAGTRLVWLVDPRTRTASVYTSPKDVTLLTEADTLHGGDVLHGFKFPLRQLFRRLDAAMSGRKGP
jgi:Uma2 family endonuclease